MFSNKATLCLLFDQVVNNGLEGVADETLDADFVGEYPERSEPIKGIDEYKKYIAGMRREFPDLHAKISDGWLTGEEDVHVVGKGNIVERVVVALSVSGTPRADGRDTSKNGGPITWSEVHLVQCRNGRILTDRVVSDQPLAAQKLAAPVAT
jgi:predicted ester cyclase